MDRFWSKVKKTKTCWLWIGRVRPDGYGEIRIDKKTRLAHRVGYELSNGSIPTGKCVLHKCDVRACIRPGHLFLGTHQDNTDDKMQKGRYAPGVYCVGNKHPSSKLTNAKVRKIKNEYRLSSRQAAAVHGVSPTLIKNIRAGRTWRHVS